MANIGLDKRGYLVNIFLIFPQKHMLWYSLEALRLGEELLINTYNMLSRRNKKNIMWIHPLVCSYAWGIQFLKVNIVNLSSRSHLML